MKTVLLPPTPFPQAAVDALREGLPVALPTETVYGLAADATRPEAVARIFEAKERPFFDPLIVHVPDRDWLPRLTLPLTAPVEGWVEALIGRFWPGPLTLVLPRSAAVPDLVASGLPTVALRQSAHPVFEAIVRAFGRPLAAPSANRFGRISPTTAAHVESELAGRIPCIVDGGPTTHGVESTIVAVRGEGLEILRSGPITREALAEIAPVLASKSAPVGETPQAPGQLSSHYAPGKPLRLLAPGERATPSLRIGLLSWQQPASGFGACESLSPRGDLREAAARLFAAMRRLDENAAVEEIVAEPVPEEGLGVAIMDRLRRAAYR